MKSQATVGRNQAIQALSVFGNNVDWDVVDPLVLQQIINNPKEAGAQFTAFLKNGGRVFTNGQSRILTVDRSKPFDPVSFPGLGEGYSIWKGLADGNGLEGEEEQDARSLALTELDLSKVQLAHMLLRDEKYVKGETKLERLQKDGRIRLDAKVFQTLWENPHLVPETWKQKTNGYTTYVYFDGTILRYPYGDRYVLCLYWYDGRWRWYCRWLDDDWCVSYPSALLAS